MIDPISVERSAYPTKLSPQNSIKWPGVSPKKIPPGETVLPAVAVGKFDCGGDVIMF